MKKVHTYLKKEYPRFLKELKEYLSFPSISAEKEHGPDILRTVKWLAAHCKKIGLRVSVEETAGNPVIIARTFTERDRRKPHFLVYGHYDVQPVDPLFLWRTEPFTSTIKNGKIFARGASDNKGQHFAHLKAVEAYLKTKTELPCDVSFVIEGEEEIGSGGLFSLLKKRRRELACDGVVISDTGMPGRNKPALTIALRGIAALEVTLTGPNRDLHSGIYGGSVENPAMALAQLLGKLRDKNGRITIPGFYEGVQKLSVGERKELNCLVSAATHQKHTGVPALFGEDGFTHLEHVGTRPTLEINGLTAGYQGEGTKTIIPSHASVKITMRLVPNQDPFLIAQRAAQYVKSICPPTVVCKVQVGHGAHPYLISPTNVRVQAALVALQKTFGRKPVLIREGGSIPIVTAFKKILDADSLLLGLALPDDNAHSPNEKFELANFKRGMALGARLWQELVV